MEEKKLVEQEAQKMGLKLSAEYIQLGGPAVVNDMLLVGRGAFRARGAARLHHDLGPHRAPT